MRRNQITKVDVDTAAASTTTHPDCSTANGNDRRWRLRKILASYETATQTGTVSVTCAGVTVSIFAFTGNAGQALDFGEDGWQMPTPGDVVVTLSAGAAAVVSHLTTIAFAE